MQLFCTFLGGFESGGKCFKSAKRFLKTNKEIFSFFRIFWHSDRLPLPYGTGGGFKLRFEKEA
jgi:hypothetical protein